MKIIRDSDEVVWWESLVVLRMMKVGDIVVLSDGTSGTIEKFAQGTFCAWMETEPENANWVFVNGEWHRDSDLFFKYNRSGLWVEGGSKLNRIVKNNDGTWGVLTCADASLRESIVPVPVMTESIRGKLIQSAVGSLYLRGFFVVSQERMRNPVFDREGEQTTTLIVYRACKNEDEAEVVKDEIERIILDH